MGPFDRITINPTICGGQPTVRGLRIQVGLIVRHIAQGERPEDVVREYPELDVEDVRQALMFAAWLASGRSEAVPTT